MQTLKCRVSDGDVTVTYSALPPFENGEAYAIHSPRLRGWNWEIYLSVPDEERPFIWFPEKPEGCSRWEAIEDGDRNNIEELIQETIFQFEDDLTA